MERTVSLGIMRVTIDLPDALHAELKRRAADEGTTMRVLILRGVDMNRKQDETSGAKAAKKQTRLRHG
jgi:hypothetical protein